MEVAGAPSAVAVVSPGLSLDASTGVSTVASPFPGVTTFDSQHQNRSIIGVAYWFPHQGNVSTALMLDYDAQHLDNITTAPTRIVFIHGLLNF